MSTSSKTTIIETDPFIAKTVQKCLESHGLTDNITVQDAAANNDNNTIQILSKTRIGTILDQCLKTQNNAENDTTQERLLPVGPYTLDPILHILHRDTQHIRLTEKESALLKLLSEAQGNIIPRETLLTDIWGYADTVETHTLETHIYRLRQKIEATPSEPKTLKTADDGYYIIV